MHLGYNTNGLAHHDGIDALRLLAEIGYRSVAITIDHATLNPYGDNLDEEVATIGRLLDQLDMKSVVETGARFLLDANVKHEPTLMSPDPAGRARRVDFLNRAIDIAARLGSDCVSLWSGVLRADDDGRLPDDQQGFDRLADGLRQVIDHAQKRNVTLGFEPEPGMFIDTMSSFEALLQQLDGADLPLTLDVGHLHCQSELPIARVVHRWAKQIVNVHIEDMRAGVHEHLMFGDGEIDFPEVIAAFAGVGYDGPLNVELSRHSHVGPAARRAFAFLDPLCKNL